MAKSKQPAASPAQEPQSNLPDRPLDNAAVARCVRAWHRAYKKADEDGEGDYKAECAGNEAYLNTMPPLAGRDNIRNFIACVAQAALMKVLRQKDVTQLLYAAQVAIGAAGREPKLPNAVTAG